jgi:acyl-coenzyme A synthetase/AMP-(fatty) acid ligase
LVAKGYWNDPARTAERFKNGEVWSGDTMVLGADGLLRFRARDDAMIKVSGNRISPTEIEEAALASGAVGDAAAFGVPDERTGQAIVLVAAGEGDEAALRAHLKRQLPPHMQPARIEWRETLPIGPNGKLDRAALKAAL